MPSAHSWYEQKSQTERTLLVLNKLVEQLKTILETQSIVCKGNTTLLSGYLFGIVHRVPRTSRLAQFFLGAEQKPLVTFVPVADFSGRARLEVHDRSLWAAHRSMFAEAVRELNTIYTRDKIILVEV